MCITFWREKLKEKCTICGRRTDSYRKEIKGKFRFIEISRRNYENNNISNVSIDFSDFNVVSCILHYDLRKINFLLESNCVFYFFSKFVFWRHSSIKKSAFGRHLFMDECIKNVNFDWLLQKTSIYLQFYLQLYCL